MKVLREKEYHMLFSKMHLSPLFLERHLIETDRMRPQGICLLIDVRCFSEMKATFPAVFEKYLTGQAVHIPKVSACHFIFVEEFQESIYKGNINLNPDYYAGQSKEVKYETSSFIWEVQIIKKGHHDVPVFDTCLQHVYFGICGDNIVLVLFFINITALPRVTAFTVIYFNSLTRIPLPHIV